VVVAEIEPERVAANAPRERESTPRPSAAAQALGLVVADLSEAQKAELKVRGGVRVEAATEAAARAGLREGDIVLAIANSEVASVREFEAALAKLDRSTPISVLFRRGEWAQYALIRPAR
jgi:serine protease Do